MWKSKKHHVAVVEIKAEAHNGSSGTNGCNGFHDNDNEDGVDICKSKVEGYFQEVQEQEPTGKSISNGHDAHGTTNGTTKSFLDTMEALEALALGNGNSTTEAELNNENKAQNSNSQIHSNGTSETVAEAEAEGGTNNDGISPLTMQNPLWPEIDKVTRDQLHYAKLGVGEGGWSLFAKDGEMKMYKREEEIDGLIMDPLKAVHTVKGVTAHELCHYFFTPEVRTEWETTLETMTILETISDDAIVFHQVHTRIWPATQRDALFWSHIRQVPDGDGQTNTWIVCNHSSKHEKDPEAPAPGKKSKDKYIRILLKVSLVCQTVIDPAKAKSGQITRDDLTCHISYCSVVNPGGWAPASGVRAVYKREYPRFLKKFTGYVIDKCKDKPIMF